MQSSGVAEVEGPDSPITSQLSAFVCEKGDEDHGTTILFSSFENVSAAVGRVLDERRTLWFSEAIVDARPAAQMSEWTKDLDDEARAIHVNLMDATHRALGDD